MWLQMANTCETIRPQKSDPILSDHKELKADGFYVLGKFWPKEVREWKAKVLLCCWSAQFSLRNHTLYLRADVVLKANYLR